LEEAIGKGILPEDVFDSSSTSNRAKKSIHPQEVPPVALAQLHVLKKFLSE
jgi:hypothetical protein